VTLNGAPNPISKSPGVLGQYKLDEPAGRWLLATTIVSSGLAFLVSTAVGIALPSIQSYFNAPLSGLQWISVAYLLPFSALLLIGGALGDHYGRRRIFFIGLALFVLGSVTSAFAVNVAMLATFQAVAGIGSALLVPQNLAFINTSFAAGERGRAIGWWAGLSGAIGVAAPWIGGIITQYFSWRGVFLLVLPFGVLLVFMARRFIRENAPVRSQRPNWILGAPLLLGFGSIIFALIRLPEYSIGLLESGVFVIGVALILMFFVLDRRQKKPMLPRKLFRSPLVAGANGATLLLYFALNGIIYFTVLNLQQVQGMSPSIGGLAILPSTLLITFLSGPFGSLADKLGPRIQMIFGPIMVAGGIFLLAFSGVGNSYSIAFLPGLITIGFGMAVVIAPLTKSALSVDESLSGVASGFNNAVARIATLFSVALLGLMMSVLFSASLAGNLEKTDLSPAQRQEIMDQSSKLGGISVPDSFDGGSRFAAQNAVRESFASAFKWTMVANAALAAGAAVVSLAAIRNPRKGG